MIQVGAKSIVSYWLVPAEPTRRFFVSAIEKLAARFQAPIFEPHVTIYVATNADEQPADIMRRVLANCQPCRLAVRDLQYSDEFTKTVFVQFEPSPSVTQLSRTLHYACASQNTYDFDPHLSLIYKKMTRRAKIDAIASVRLPFTEVLFDLAKAVVCPGRVRSRQDVESWRVTAEQRLIE